MSKLAFRFPRIDERVAILGCTGSGKTTQAAFILAHAPFDQMPYIAIDYKGDDLLGSIERIREISVHEKVPTRPGLYVLRPRPSDTDAVENWLWKVWHNGYTGLYVDEAYLIPNKEALKNILVQGRSLRIPCIFASQRPVNVPREVFTEASHLSVFRLNDRKDKERVAEFSPYSVKELTENRLPEYHSRWYNVADDATAWLSPVPKAEKIVEIINDRLAPEYHVS